MTTASIYDQLPVSDGQFRLLQVLYGNYDDDLDTKLAVHDLSSRPSFHAISYTWGSSDEVMSLNVNGSSHGISPNAAAAIRSCRHERKLVLLWIDQVCINQHDLSERSSQVLLMSEIYSSAQQVNVCLQNRGEGPVLLFDFLEALQKCRASTWFYWIFGPSTIPSSTQPLKAILGDDLNLSKSAWQYLSSYNDCTEALERSLELLLSDPWFQRAWVVQEAVLAEKLVLICGKTRASWDSLFELALLQPKIYKKEPRPQEVAVGWKSIAALTTVRSKVRPAGLRTRLQVLGHAFSRDLRYPTWQQVVANMRLSWRSFVRPPDLGLLIVMRIFRDWQSSDGRDKVLGFLGLRPAGNVDVIPFQSTNSTPGEGEASLSYVATVSMVCLAFTWYQIETTGTLDVLMASCYSATAHEDLPFWVADWSQKTPYCDTWYGCWLAPWPFSPGQHRAVPSFIAKDKALILRGVEVDIVDKVVQNPIRVATYDKPSHPVWTEWQKLAMEIYEPKDPYGTTEAAHFDAFWRTLTYDTDRSGRRATPDRAKKYRDWFAGRVDPTDTDITGQILFKNRMLFRTRRGYLGNACSNVQPGDRVFLLHGGRLPFVLRRERQVEGETSALSSNGNQSVRKSVQAYRLVGGDSYVHGICEEDVRRALEAERVVQEIALI